jgi:hypothetical protein
MTTKHFLAMNTQSFSRIRFVKDVLKKLISVIETPSTPLSDMINLEQSKE